MRKIHLPSVACIVFFTISCSVTGTAYFSTGGNWSQAATWTITGCGGGAGAVPGIGDDVTICSGTVDVDIAGNCNSLTIANGATLSFNTQNLTFTVATFINIQGGATGGLLNYPLTHSNVILDIGGNLTCTAPGTFTFINGVGGHYGTVNFNGAANAVMSGAGTITLASLSMNKTTTAATVNVSATNVVFDTPYALVLTKGTFQWNNAGTLTDSYDVGSTTTLTIPFGGVLESDAGTFQLCKTGNVTLSGELLLNGGVVNAAAPAAGATAFDFLYLDNGGTPQLYVNTGTLNVYGGINNNKLSANFIDFRMTGGTINLSLGQDGPAHENFQLENKAGGTTIMSGGLITLQDGSANSVDLNFGGSLIGAMGSAHYNVTGGTVQFGTASSFDFGNNFTIAGSTTNNYPNFVINGISAAHTAQVTLSSTASLLIQSLVINNSFSTMQMKDGSGGLTDNLIITGTNGTDAFINNGAASTAGSLTTTGSFTAQQSTVTFSGTVQQTIGGSATTTFYNLTLNNTSGVTPATGILQNVATSVDNVMTFTKGAYNLNTNTLTLLNSAAGAMTGGSVNSFLISEDQVTGSMASAVQWNIGNNAFSYLFPFGCSSTYIPFTFLVTGASGDATTTLTLATYECINGTNLPWPSLAGEAVTATNGNNPNSAGCFPLTQNNSNLQVNRYWEITVGATVPTATLTFSYLGTENNTLAGCGGGAAGSVSAQRWDVVNQVWGTVGGAGLVYPINTASYAFGAGVGNVSVAGLSTFSPWTLVSVTEPLPVQLLSFTATAHQKEDVLVSWNTASEINNNFFTVERTNNGSDFEYVGTVKGSGNSSIVHGYKLTDPYPFSGVSYYRLSQTDFNGHRTIYNPVPVDLIPPVRVNVFPSPSHGDALYLSLIGEPVNEEILVLLYDLEGRTTYSKVFITGQTGSVLEVINHSARLAPGIYLVVATSQNSIYKQKVVVE